MLKGWDDQTMFNLTIQRQMAIITGEITNRTMGGKGVVDYIMKVFPLPHDKIVSNEMTPEKITELITLYNARQAAKRKNNGGTT
jgi:hypothetical protein